MALSVEHGLALIGSGGYMYTNSMALEKTGLIIDLLTRKNLIEIGFNVVSRDGRESWQLVMPEGWSTMSARDSSDEILIRDSKLRKRVSVKVKISRSEKDFIYSFAVTNTIEIFPRYYIEDVFDHEGDSFVSMVRTLLLRDRSILSLRDGDNIIGKAYYRRDSANHQFNQALNHILSILT